MVLFQHTFFSKKNFFFLWQPAASLGGCGGCNKVAHTAYMPPTTTEPPFAPTPSVEGERYGVGKWGRIATARLLPHRAELQGLSREPKVMRESLLIIFKRNFQGKFILKIINRPHRPSLEGLPAWTPFCRNFASAISQRRLTHKR